MGKHTASGSRSARGDGTNQLHELLADAWVQLARERHVEFLGADQFLDIGEIAEPVGCGHAGGELQFDQPRQLEDANSLDFDRVLGRVRKGYGLWLPVSRILVRDEKLDAYAGLDVSEGA